MDEKGARSSNTLLSCEDEMDLRRGPWTVDEDLTLINYIATHGEGRWNTLALSAGNLLLSLCFYLLLWNILFTTKTLLYFFQNSAFYLMWLWCEASTFPCLQWLLESQSFVDYSDLCLGSYVCCVDKF